MKKTSLFEILKNYGTNDLNGFLWNYLSSMLFQPFHFGNLTNKKIIDFIYLVRSFGRLKEGVFRTSIVNFLWTSNWIIPNIFWPHWHSNIRNWTSRPVQLHVGIIVRPKKISPYPLALSSISGDSPVRPYINFLQSL